MASHSSSCMVTASSLETGQTVYDRETPTYEVVAVLDGVASEVTALEEQTDRGHVIHEEQTVADRHPEYPADDIVVKVRRQSDGRELLWPISRLTTTSPFTNS